MNTPTALPSPFDCTSGRHKVIGVTPAGHPDGICVVCGARGVIDARRLPPPDLQPTPDVTEPLAL